LPGNFRVEAENYVDTFTITSVTAGTAPQFSPDIDTLQNSESERRTNRVYISKLQEPEAVPLTNYLDVGSSDEAIVAIATLRDRIIVVKERSIHRITGSDLNNFAVQLVDNTVKVSEIRTVVNLSNRVFALSNQGIIAISDSVQILSRQVHDLVKGPFTDCHATTKETDGLYILTCENADGYYSVIYNSFNALFTTWELPRSTSFSYNLEDQLFYSVPEESSEFPILVERNSGSSLDYSEISSSYSVTGIDGGTYTFSSGTGLEVGMVLTENSGTGKVVITSIEGNVAEVNILSSPTASSGTWTAYDLIDVTVKFWPYIGQGIDTYKSFNETALIFTTQISGTVTARYLTDLNNIEESVSFSTISDTSGWGLFQWGNIPWGEDPDSGITLVKRIMVPWEMGKGHELTFTVDISTSNQLWEFSGVSLKYDNIDFTPMTT
jgi:hypothetical protein